MKIKRLGLIFLAWLMGAAQIGLADTANHFYFAQITDTHMGVLDHNERTQKAVAAINRIQSKLKDRLAFTVHTGDFAEELTLDAQAMARARSIMDKLKTPVHYVPGNNDIRVKKPMATRRTWETTMGPQITSAEYQGVVFIFANTEPLAQDFEMTGYDPMAAIEGFMAQAQGKPIILFHHSPCIGKFKKGKTQKGWPKATRTQWISLLNKYGVKAVIAGHFHQDEMHWLGEVPLFSSPPISSRWGRQAAFRVFEYKDGRIGYRTQYLQ